MTIKYLEHHLGEEIKVNMNHEEIISSLNSMNPKPYGDSETLYSSFILKKNDNINYELLIIEISKKVKYYWWVIQVHVLPSMKEQGVKLNHQLLFDYFMESYSEKNYKLLLGLVPWVDELDRKELVDLVIDWKKNAHQ